jgi:predicted nucleotide-binding protein
MKQNNRIARRESAQEMKEGEIIRKLMHAGLRIVNIERNGNDTGCRIDCAQGAVVNVYDTGKITVQGKNQEPVKRALGLKRCAREDRSD